MNIIARRNRHADQDEDAAFAPLNRPSGPSMYLQAKGFFAKKPSPNRAISLQIADDLPPPNARASGAIASEHRGIPSFQACLGDAQQADPGNILAPAGLDRPF